MVGQRDFSGFQQYISSKEILLFIRIYSTDGAVYRKSSRNGIAPATDQRVVVQR